MPGLDDLIARLDGVARRDRLLRQLPRHVVDNALRSGRLIRWLPGVLADPHLIEEPRRQLLAAVAYTNGRGVITHESGLWVWDVLDRDELHRDELHRNEPAGVDVSVPAGVRLVGGPHLRVHECSDMARLRPVVRDGIPLASLEACVVTAWGSMPDEQRRAAAIAAVRERRTTAARLKSCADGHARLPGRAGLLRLCDQLASGAHSEFEIWGVQHFFDADLLARSVPQHRVAVSGRVCFIDRVFEAEMVAVELDGTRWHDRPTQRERDRRRDAALATLGWLTVRLSWRRLHSDLEGARAELRAILATRSSQLARRGA